MKEFCIVDTRTKKYEGKEKMRNENKNEKKKYIYIYKDDKESMYEQFE